nr:uncharacterized protein [uncultured bacterium]
MALASLNFSRTSHGRLRSKCVFGVIDDLLSASRSLRSVEQMETLIARRIGRGEGLAPTLERRYGLNPAAGAYR